MRPDFGLAVDGRELGAGVHTGIGRYVLEVLRAASRRGWRCTVYRDAACAFELEIPGVTPRILPTRITPWWDQVSLPTALARDGASVFLSPYYKAPLRAPCPVVITIHDLFFIGYPGRRRPVRDVMMLGLARLYARRAAAIVTDSEHSRRAVEERLGVDPAKVTVIPVALGEEFGAGAQPDGIPARYGIASPYLLYVGNFKPHKNLPRLLSAYAALPGKLRRGHTLVLAGADRDGRPALEALAARLGLGDRVLFPGRISDEDLPALYAGARVFVLPSLEEGFGLPALEAMACGAPVVASNRGALPEVVGDAAIRVDAESESELSQALARVLVDGALREDLVRRGLARAALFSSDRTAGRVLELCRQVAEGTR